MPFTFRDAFIFEGRGHGWKETYFHQHSNGSLDTAIAYMRDTLAPKRAKLLGAEYTLKAVECSIELDNDGDPVIGDSAISYKDLAGFADEGGADPALAILFKLQNTTRVKRRNTYLRGFWDSVEIDGGKYVPTNPVNPWITFMLDFITGLQGMGETGTRGAGWLNSQRTNPLGVPIVSVASQSDQSILITFGADVVWPDGLNYANRLTINPARQRTKLAGTWTVIPDTLRTCKTIDKIAIFPTTTLGWKGFTSEFVFTTAAFYDDQKVTKRAPGRPLLEFRGRAAARRLG